MSSKKIKQINEDVKIRFMRPILSRHNIEVIQKQSYGNQYLLNTISRGCEERALFKFNELSSKDLSVYEDLLLKEYKKYRDYIDLLVSSHDKDKPYVSHETFTCKFYNNDRTELIDTLVVNINTMSGTKKSNINIKELMKTLNIIIKYNGYSKLKDLKLYSLCINKYGTQITAKYSYTKDKSKKEEYWVEE